MLTSSLTLNGLLNFSPVLEINDVENGLIAGIVERENIACLPEAWTNNACGFYILLSPVKADNTFQAYVGKVIKGFGGMLKNHEETKDYWKTAIMFKMSGSTGFGINQSAYLEGKIREIMASSPDVLMMNILPPWDHILTKREIPSVREALHFGVGVLSLRGYTRSSMAQSLKLIQSSILGERLETLMGKPEDDNYPPLSISHPPITTIDKFPDITAHQKTSVHLVSDDNDMFLRLKAWRTGQSRSENVPAYVISSNRTLKDIAGMKPTTKDDLIKIAGMGKVKVERYGDAILNILNFPESISA